MWGKKESKKLVAEKEKTISTLSEKLNTTTVTARKISFYTTTTTTATTDAIDTTAITSTLDVGSDVLATSRTTVVYIASSKKTETVAGNPKAVSSGSGSSGGGSSRGSSSNGGSSGGSSNGSAKKTVVQVNPSQEKTNEEENKQETTSNQEQSTTTSNQDSSSETLVQVTTTEKVQPITEVEDVYAPRIIVEELEQQDSDDDETAEIAKASVTMQFIGSSDESWNKYLRMLSLINDIELSKGDSVSFNDNIDAPGSVEAYFLSYMVKICGEKAGLTTENSYPENVPSEGSRISKETKYEGDLIITSNLENKINIQCWIDRINKTCTITMYEEN